MSQDHGAARVGYGGDAALFLTLVLIINKQLNPVWEKKSSLYCSVYQLQIQMYRLKCHSKVKSLHL